jgi:hypothetical protein
LSGDREQAILNLQVKEGDKEGFKSQLDAKKRGAPVSSP